MTRRQLDGDEATRCLEPIWLQCECALELSTRLGNLLFAPVQHSSLRRNGSRSGKAGGERVELGLRPCDFALRNQGTNEQELSIRVLRLRLQYFYCKRCG